MGPATVRPTGRLRWLRWWGSRAYALTREIAGLRQLRDAVGLRVGNVCFRPIAFLMSARISSHRGDSSGHQAVRQTPRSSDTLDMDAAVIVSGDRYRPPSTFPVDDRGRATCRNEHWFTHLLHARTVIETWRRKYNEERPKKALGGLTPSAYAKQLASTTINPRL